MQEFRRERLEMLGQEKKIMDDNKRQQYEQFCQKTYVPIYSKPWWLDSVCGENNWDVWFYYSGNEIVAAMPYYKEIRGANKYITKALLSQNNGIIFKYPPNSKIISKQKYEEKVINAACEYINSLKIDVYEQQFHYSFTNWLPFFWNYYTAIVRYTYVIENTKDLESVWQGVSSKCRGIIKKGQKSATFKEGLDPDVFYREHEKIFLKQDLKCPISYNTWIKLYRATVENNAGKIIYAETKEGDIASVMFLVWDEKSVYLLLAGSIPEYQALDTYDSLIWEGIKFAHEKGLKYDFEGSVIKRISKSFREFGGEPNPYFRIRKVFNPEIVRQEAEDLIKTNKLEKVR